MIAPPQGIVCESLRQAILDDNGDEAVRAMDCLGKKKSVIVVNLLIELLAFRQHFEWEGTGFIPHIVTPQQRYPAVQALTEIGEPALPSAADIRGRLRNGKQWRHIGDITETVTYRDVSEEAG